MGFRHNHAPSLLVLSLETQREIYGEGGPVNWIPTCSRGLNLAI